MCHSWPWWVAARAAELWVPAGMTQNGGYRERAGSSPRSRARKSRTSSPSTWAAWRLPMRCLTATLRPGTSGSVSVGAGRPPGIWAVETRAPTSRQAGWGEGLEPNGAGGQAGSPCPGERAAVRTPRGTRAGRGEGLGPGRREAVGLGSRLLPWVVGPTCTAWPRAHLQDREGRLPLDHWGAPVLHQLCLWAA